MLAGYILYSILFGIFNRNVFEYLTPRPIRISSLTLNYLQKADRTGQDKHKLYTVHFTLATWASQGQVYTTGTSVQHNM